ncbi:MAG: hypothetical protein IKL37_00080 [Alphaproteobacteria bacterium]|nr:hypothetical protein [Alphaproteobacteria bacterium]
MEPFLIDIREQYDLCKAHGIEPLIDRRFTMEIRLRVSIQRELFGTGHTPAENERFYRFCWDHYPHICAECMRPLRQYSATYVSHIMTRGAHPETAHDCRNVNILCFSHHSVWENGNRKNMRIYQRNLQIVEELKKEYSAI